MKQQARIWLAAAFVLLLCIQGAEAQGVTRLCVPIGTGSSCPPVTTANPLPVTGAITATSEATATAAAPSYSEGTVNPLSQNLTGDLRVIAKQSTSPWIAAGGGTAGTAATGVLTVQGIASMTPLLATVSQATASGLNATVVGTGTFATQSAVTAASGSYASGAFASGSFASGSHASGSFASGAFASGSVASGAYASGSLASGAMVDLTNLSTPITPATATATKAALFGLQYNSTQATFTNGQQGSVQGTSRGAVYVATGADAFTVAAALNTTPTIANGNGIVPAPSTEALASITPIVSGALESNHVICAAACNFYSGYVTTGATAGWLLIANATSAPTAGGAAIAPISCVVAPANQTTSISGPGNIPLRASTGVVLVFSSSGCLTNTASTTAYFSGLAK